jgi:hypothetical protein
VELSDLKHHIYCFKRGRAIQELTIQFFLSLYLQSFDFFVEKDSMVFQKRMIQQQRRRRPWLCGGITDTDEVAVPSTIAKTLNKKKQNQRSEKLPAGAVDSRTGSSSTGCDESSSSGNDSREQIDMNIPLWKAGTFLLHR